MSEGTVGHCLYLYLQNFSVFWTLEEQEKLPPELKEDEATLASFRERASEQAVTLLEGLFSGLLCGSSAVPYRTDRRSQRRTVRNDWYLEGRLYRPRERVARTHWSFCLGELKEKGPAVCFVLKTHEPASTVAMDRLATLVAASTGLESANARDCFAHDSSYDSGVLAAAVPLRPDQLHPAVLDAAASQLKLFFQNFKEKFEEAIDA
jgi:hypothetical protein